MKPENPNCNLFNVELRKHLLKTQKHTLTPTVGWQFSGSTSMVPYLLADYHSSSHTNYMLDEFIVDLLGFDRMTSRLLSHANDWYPIAPLLSLQASQSPTDFSFLFDIKQWCSFASKTVSHTNLSMHMCSNHCSTFVFPRRHRMSTAASSPPKLSHATALLSRTGDLH